MAKGPAPLCGAQRAHSSGGAPGWSRRGPSVLAARAAAWTPPPRPERGYAQLYFDTVLQAEEGCDFAFLRGRPAGVPDEPAPGVT